MLNTKKKLAGEFIGLALLIAIVVLIIVAICSITVPAKAEGDVSFPSYWEYDAELVKNLQRALNTYGEDIKVDGKFGPKTARAVKNVQARYNLDTTGVVDDSFAWSFGVTNWPKGQTMYYMADLEAIYDQSEYEDMLYISLGGRSGTQHFSLFRDGILIAETNLTIKNPEKFPVGYLTFDKLNRRGWFRKVNLPKELSAWLYANESEDITVVIDDRNFQPSSLGYADLIEDSDYFDWD